MDMAGQLHHVEIYVSDLSSSINFWGWFLEIMGYSKSQEWDTGISWINGNTYIVLVQTQEKYLKNQYKRCNVGLNHIAFWGRSNEYIDELLRQLKEKNITILYEDKYPYAGGEGYYALYFEEPVDRIKIEVVSSQDEK